MTWQYPPRFPLLVAKFFQKVYHFSSNSVNSMFGAFRPSSIASGGLLWKNPWRLSATRKAHQRERLKIVDDVIARIVESGVEMKSVTRAVAMPTEEAMPPKDKYTTYSRHYRGYRKSVHKVPKFTRLSLRENPLGF